MKIRNITVGFLAAGGISLVQLAAAGYISLMVVGNAAAQNVCTVSGSTLSQAKSSYANQCSLPRRDCDPVNGKWWCSSSNVGSNPVATSGGGSTGGSTSGSTGSHPAYATRAQPWSDSYSVNGRCHCATTFDHGIGGVSVTTPVGKRTVRQVCAAIKSKYGNGSSSGRVYYNTVQCGRQPANNAADEKVCPGIPIRNGSYTGQYCKSTGSAWPLSGLFSTSGGSTTGSGGACTATGSNLSAAKRNYANSCSEPRRDCDPNNGGYICSSQNL